MSGTLLNLTSPRLFREYNFAEIKVKFKGKSIKLNQIKMLRPPFLINQSIIKTVLVKS